MIEIQAQSPCHKPEGLLPNFPEISKNPFNHRTHSNWAPPLSSHPIQTPQKKQPTNSTPINKKKKKIKTMSSSSSFTLRPSSLFPSTSTTSRKLKPGFRVKCGLKDFIGGDLIKPDLGRWLDDVEKHKALAIYSPHEGGYEGRYLLRLRYQGYRFLDVSARGLGDPEATLTKIHPVCPPHLGRQPIARWYFPPEVDYRLSLLPPDAKGLVVWVIEAKVLSKAELQFLALLPTLRPKVKVIAECGNWRKFVWKPLREIAGLPLAGE